jgi:acetoin utilization deacetylase AcuC-like enzyme
VTEKLVDIANTTCQGRIVSVLEGGYQLAGEFTSAFAKSVFAHVHSLALGGKSQRTFDQRRVDLEGHAEEQVCMFD